MKKLMKLLLPLAVLGLPGLALAQTAPAPTPTDSALVRYWNLATNDGKDVHFLDNGTAVSLYDFNRKEWLGGAMTSLYQPKLGTLKGKDLKPVSFDLGVAKSIEQGQTAFPFMAVRLHGRDLLAQTNDSVKSFFEARQNLLKYLTCGGWVARDWNIGDYRYGGFTGVEVKWGGS